MQCLAHGSSETVGRPPAVDGIERQSGVPAPQAGSGWGLPAAKRCWPGLAEALEAAAPRAATALPASTAFGRGPVLPAGLGGDVASARWLVPQPPPPPPASQGCLSARGHLDSPLSRQAHMVVGRSECRTARGAHTLTATIRYPAQGSSTGSMPPLPKWLQREMSKAARQLRKQSPDTPGLAAQQPWIDAADDTRLQFFPSLPTKAEVLFIRNQLGMSGRTTGSSDGREERGRSARERAQLRQAEQRGVHVAQRILAQRGTRGAPSREDLGPAPRILVQRSTRGSLSQEDRQQQDAPARGSLAQALQDGEALGGSIAATARGSAVNDAVLCCEGQAEVESPRSHSVTFTGVLSSKETRLNKLDRLRRAGHKQMTVNSIMRLANREALTCGKCMAELTQDSLYCGHCGSQVVEVRSTEQISSEKLSLDLKPAP